MNTAALIWILNIIYYSQILIDSETVNSDQVERKQYEIGFTITITTMTKLKPTLMFSAWPLSVTVSKYFK